MKKFENLEELYLYIEDKSFNHLYSGQQFSLRGISLLFEEFARNKETKGNQKSDSSTVEKFIKLFKGKSLNEVTNLEEIEKAKWEELFFGFELYFNNFFSSSYTKIGDDFVPTYDSKSLTLNHIKLLKNRLEIAQHPILKSRYAHLLFLKSNNEIEKVKYGKIALDNYLLLLELLDDERIKRVQVENNKDKGKYEIHYIFQNVIINASCLAFLLNLKLEETKKWFLEILDEEKCIEVIVLIQFMLSKPDLFNKNDFKDLQDKCFKIGMDVMKPRDPHYSGVAMEYFKAGKEISTICEIKKYNWDKIISDAEIYLEDILAIYQQIFDAVDKYKEE